MQNLFSLLIVANSAYQREANLPQEIINSDDRSLQHLDQAVVENLACNILLADVVTIRLTVVMSERKLQVFAKLLVTPALVDALWLRVTFAIDDIILFNS